VQECSNNWIKKNPDSKELGGGGGSSLITQENALTTSRR